MIDFCYKNPINKIITTLVSVFMTLLMAKPTIKLIGQSNIKKKQSRKAKTKANKEAKN